MLIQFLKGQVTTSSNMSEKPIISQYQVTGRTAMTLKDGENGIFSVIKLVNQHIRLFLLGLPRMEQAL